MTVHHEQERESVLLAKFNRHILNNFNNSNYHFLFASIENVPIEMLVFVANRDRWRVRVRVRVSRYFFQRFLG